MNNLKKILCFGDSNVYGFNPQNFQRYNQNERWSGILKNYFKEKYIIKENGYNNRCGFNYNKIENLNGKLCLLKELENNYDYIILQIGINDTQIQYNSSENIIAQGLEELVKLIKNTNNKTKVFILCPQVIDKYILNSYFQNMFDLNSIELSSKYEKIYKRICDKYDCKFINLNTIAKTSTLDGLHYDVENNKKIADYIINLLK